MKAQASFVHIKVVIGEVEAKSGKFYNCNLFCREEEDDKKLAFRTGSD